MKSPNWVLWSTHQELEEFYSENRNQPKDLYPSERRFLPWLAKEVDSVLDTGCAAGGFFNIWRNYNQSIVYTGLDLSSSLIKAARNLVPGSTFLEGNVVDGVDLPDRSSMVVQALG